MPGPRDGRTVTLVTRVIIAWLLGAVVGTILWFALSPFLTSGQEDAVSWLLMGSYAVVLAVSLYRARRRADRSPSART